MKNSADKHVTLLMGVHNGAAHLPAQLFSLAEQSHKNWSLHCNDDASTDISVDILTDFQQTQHQNVRINHGPQRGFSANFLSLIRQLPTDPGYIAFTDQDDIWCPDKIKTALNSLDPYQGAPALYAGRRWNWLETSRRLTASPTMKQPFVFENALIENVASGNTIVINPAAAQLIRSAARKISDVFAFDWWIYQMITGAGGQVIFDNGEPQIYYRQHAQNAIGAGLGARAQLERKLSVLKGAFADRMTGNIAALNQCSDALTPQSRSLLHRFAAARNSPWLNRIQRCRDLGLFRQHKIGTAGFYGAATLGRI